MINRLLELLRAGGASLVGLLLELFESRAKALALLSALLIGLVLGVVLRGEDPSETCQMAPKWLLVNVYETVVVSTPDDGSFTGNILDRILGRARQTEPGELGLRMLNTCRIGGIRAGLNNGRKYSAIDMLAGPNVDSHVLTVKESISEICAVLDCGDATATPLAQEVIRRNQSERDVLVALYEATGGAYWTNANGWMTDLPISDWHGVSTLPDENGKVMPLPLGGNELTGANPAELGSLRSLDALFLRDNELTGSIPAELGNLASLTLLDLSGNKLTGSIPAELGKLKNLTMLILGGNELTGAIPAELGSLRSVSTLVLRDNELTESIPAELGKLKNLTALMLEGNELTGSIPAELGKLTNLTALKLTGNVLTGAIPAELGSLRSLTMLILGDNELTGSIPAELGNLASLTFLDLYGNKLTGSIPVELGKLKNLTALMLVGNDLNGPIPVELGNLVNLKNLAIDTNTGLCLAEGFPQTSQFGTLALEGGLLVC